MDANIISGLKNESARLKKLAKKIDEILSEFEAPTTIPEFVTLSLPQVEYAEEKRDDLSKLTQADAIRRILIEEGKALRRDEIFAAATSRGVKIKSVQNLSSILSRDKRFASAKRGIWFLAINSNAKDNQTAFPASIMKQP